VIFAFRRSLFTLASTLFAVAFTARLLQIVFQDSGFPRRSLACQSSNLRDCYDVIDRHTAPIVVPSRCADLVGNVVVGLTHYARRATESNSPRRDRRECVTWRVHPAVTFSASRSDSESVNPLEPGLAAAVFPKRPRSRGEGFHDRVLEKAPHRCRRIRRRVVFTFITGLLALAALAGIVAVARARDVGFDSYFARFKGEGNQPRALRRAWTRSRTSTRAGRTIASRSTSCPGFGPDALRVLASLEQAGKQKKVRSNENMDENRYPPQAPSISNPDGLAVGFVKDTYQGKEYAGLTFSHAPRATRVSCFTRGRVIGSMARRPAPT
jgi:hypothetical protein